MSLGRGIAGILVVIAIAYLFSYDRKRIDWKLVGGGLLIQLVLALSIHYLCQADGLYKCGIGFPVRSVCFEVGRIQFLASFFADRCFLLGFGFYLLLLGNYPESSRRVVVVTAEGDEYIRYRRFGCLW